MQIEMMLFYKCCFQHFFEIIDLYGKKVRYYDGNQAFCSWILQSILLTDFFFKMHYFISLHSCFNETIKYS